MNFYIMEANPTCETTKVCHELCPPQDCVDNSHLLIAFWQFNNNIKHMCSIYLIGTNNLHWKGWRFKYNCLSAIKLGQSLSCNQYLLTKCQILLSPQIGIRCSHHTENIVLTKLLVPTSVDVTTESFSDEITAGLIDSLVFALCRDNHTCAQIRRPLLDIEVSCVWWRYAEITWS